MALFFTPRLEIFVYLWRECGCWTAGWESRGGLGKGSRVLGAGGQHCPVSTLSRENMVRPWVTSGSRPAPPQGPGTSLLEVIITPGSLGDTWCHFASDITRVSISIVITGTLLSAGRWNRHVCSLLRPELYWAPVQVGWAAGWQYWPEPSQLIRAQATAQAQGLPTQICRHCRCLRIRFCKLFVTVNIPIEEYFSQISVAINIPRHQIKFLCAFLIDPLLWILNTFMIRFLNTSLCFNKWTRHSTLLTCYIFLKPVNDNHRLIRDPAPR